MKAPPRSVRNIAMSWRLTFFYFFEKTLFCWLINTKQPIWSKTNTLSTISTLVEEAFNCLQLLQLLFPVYEYHSSTNLPIYSWKDMRQWMPFDKSTVYSIFYCASTRYVCKLLMILIILYSSHHSSQNVLWFYLSSQLE